MKAVKEITTKYYKTIFEQATAGEYSVTLLPNTLYKLEIVGAGGGTYGSRVDYGNGGWTAVVRSGGSGGLINTYFYIPNDTDTTFTVTIGLGGVVGNGVKGGNSIFALDGLNLLVAEGGNGGSTSTNNAIGGITSIATEFENNYMIKQTQNNGNVGGIYQELHVKGSAYYFSDWCVANLSGGLSPIDNTQYGYGAGAGCVNVTPYNGIDGYCRIMQETTEDDYEIKEETAIYKLVRKKEGFDLSKFTVVGSPTITDDGIYTCGYDKANYVKVPFDNTLDNFSIDIEINILDRSQLGNYLGHSNNISYGFMDAHFNGVGATDFRIRVLDETGTVQTLGMDASNYLVGTEKINVTFTGTQYILTRTRADGVVYTKTVNSTFKPATNFFSLGCSNKANVPSSTINLTKITVTTDGKEVFTGAKEKFYAIGD